PKHEINTRCVGQVNIFIDDLRSLFQPRQKALILVMCDHGNVRKACIAPVRHMSVCQIAADDGGIRSFARKRRAVETAGSDFDLGDPSVRKNYDTLGTRLTTVIGTVRLTMIEYIPSSIDALN